MEGGMVHLDSTGFHGGLLVDAIPTPPSLISACLLYSIYVHTYSIGQIWWNVYICRLHCALPNEGDSRGFSYLYLLAVTIFIALGAHMCLHSYVFVEIIHENAWQFCVARRNFWQLPPLASNGFCIRIRGWQRLTWLAENWDWDGMDGTYVYAIWLAARRLRFVGWQGHKLSPTPRLPASVRGSLMRTMCLKRHLGVSRLSFQLSLFCEQKWISDTRKNGSRARRKLCILLALNVFN